MYQFFESAALNFTVYFVLVLVVPLGLMAHTAITLKAPTRNELLKNGGLLILCCILIAPLLLSLLDTVGKYEKDYQSCQIEYIYAKLSAPENTQNKLKKCEQPKEITSKELYDFKTFLAIAILFVNVILISFGVNLIAAASSMSNERICQDNVNKQINSTNTRVNKLKSKIDDLTAFSLILLIVVFILGICVLNT